MKVQRAVQTAQRADLRNQVTAGLDKLGKIAGMPGADIDAVNLRADELVGGLGRSSGLDDAASAAGLQGPELDDSRNAAGDFQPRGSRRAGETGA
ncbi:hypothetical protein SNK04_014155 [Fusarium graminearum]